MDYRADWTYDLEDDKRARDLANCPPFCELVRRLADLEQGDIEFQIDRGYIHEVMEAKRPIFYLNNKDNLADLFFNGVCGYRAQYYQSPENGLKANRYALSRLEEILVKAAEKKKCTYIRKDSGDKIVREEMTRESIIQSLRLPSAKIWGDEHAGELQELAQANSVNDNPQIIAPRWIEYAKRGEQKACQGIKAPRLTTLKFHGGFIRNGKEAIPADKMSRSEDIYFWGFS